MKRIIAGLLGASLSLVCGGTAVAQPSPRISGQISAPECVDAMALAKHMYSSTSTYVYAPLQMPGHMASTMILGATNVDISGGDALAGNSDHFENPFHESNGVSGPHIHWGKDAPRAGRIVITADTFGWRGDAYSLYIIHDDVTPEQFRTDLKDTNQHHHYSPLIDGSWRTPLVFLSKTTGKSWLIDVGDTYETTGQWDIYLADGGDYKRACRINFWPAEGQARAPRVLPEEVRKLADLLDQTLGYGPEEGTLQPTATLRMLSQHTWKNVAYRPWAVSDADAYNSEEQVDYGLLAWSHTGPSYARLYAKIRQTYPAAESALARYYESHFKLPKVRAKQVAHWILDVAYRSNFCFSGGTPSFMRQGHVSSNPWIDQ